MTSRFKKATREQIKLRMALDGPSGSGKSITSLRLAYALAALEPGREWRIAVIDSESGSARKYVGEEWDGRLLEFDVLELTTFAPTEYTSAIEEAGREKYDVIVCDSLSHAWEGTDGALDQVDRKGNGNRFTAWKDVTPQHRRMIEAILNSPAHVIATMRSKTEYVLEPDEKGKMVPRRVGVAPVQRQGMEYEFDIYGSLDWSHVMTISKSRCRAVDGMIVVKPGPAFMSPVIEWLTRGSPAKPARVSPLVNEQQMQTIAGLLSAIGWKMEKLLAELPRRCGVTELRLVSGEQATWLIDWLKAHAAAAEKRKSAAATANKPPVPIPAAPLTDSHVEVDPAPTAPKLTAEQAEKEMAEHFCGSNGNRANGAATGLISAAQLETLKTLNAAWIDHQYATLANQGVVDDAADQKVREWWGNMLQPFGVKSARELKSNQADKLIASLRRTLADDGVRIGGAASTATAAPAKSGR